MGRSPAGEDSLLGLDMAEGGELTGRTFTPTPNLVLRFKEYGALVSERCGRCRRRAGGSGPYRFTENGPDALRLQSYGGRLLQFAHGVTLRPNPDYFGRHRTFHGFR